ncbi:MAG TPA: methylated-DNA--[protein]-cysteine S-methyltransferase [Terracidiphilus sp.]|jgi:AraC family transcriptional regulator of adaptative response/methylated-DNA-[protein]-cysteine methyltransferase|nr:methylated-DNA--[protein]-cysteine S-methyltransferase [Terracidiphilus sp.]
MNATLQPAPAARIQSFDPETAWRQLQARDPQAPFLYAVATTGVFCRPACGSRRPLRENVRFFLTAAQARAAGFRPCLRCKPESCPTRSPIDTLRAHLEANLDRTVSLDELGRISGLSPFTAQRLFKQAMGVSPKQYQRALRAGSLRSALKQGSSVTDAIYNSGFNSSSRAYEGATLGMTPSRFAAGGRGEQIGYAAARTPFGWMIVGATPRGLCWLALADSAAEAEQTLRAEFPAAELHRDPSLSRLVDAALASVREGSDLPLTRNSSHALDLRGTVFQLRVWQALRQIPRGETRSYSQLAAEMGQPKATRAVARACAINRVAVLVPCHRVVGVSGSLTGYRWGVERKRRLLEAERNPR